MWDKLSMRDRAFLIRQAVKNGITDIGSIKDTWEHRFDGEENQTVEETPWYQKMLNFLGETASMRRDARTGNVGATIVRDLYDSGNKEKADELSAQILAANLTGMTLATGAAAVPASTIPTTGMEAVNLINTVNIPMKQKLAQNAVNVLGSLVGGEFINRTSQAFGYEGFGDAAYSTVMPNKTNRTPVDNVLISALDAFNPGYYVGISGIKSTKDLKNTNAAKSKKSKLTPDEKFKKALANYTEGADYVFYDPVKLRQRLRKEGVSPELLTDDNLKNLIHNRATSMEHISSVPKFAIRQPYGPGYQYNLYYANNNPTNVGYIEITPGHIGMTPANRINMVRNSSGWNSKTPVKGVSETAYNAVINDLGSVVSGENLQSAHITEKVLSKFNNKKVINNHGFWTRDGKLTVGNPVYELTTPTFDVPTGYEDDFSLEAFDDSGHFINNISRGPIYKNGGKTNTIAKTDLSHATDDSFIEKLAYNIGSNPRVKDAGSAEVISGDMLLGLVNTILGKQPYQYDDLKAFLGHPEDFGYEKTDDNTGPQFPTALQMYPEGSVQTYKGTINPYNEYVVSQDDYDKFIEMAKKGTIFYSNADMEALDYINKEGNSTYLNTGYRDDVQNYPIQFIIEGDKLYANAADLYDFDLSTFQGRTLTKYGNPYIRRQNRIPVRAITLPEGFLDRSLYSKKSHINGIPITDEMKRARNMNVIVKNKIDKK